jgi:hypothetical protein
MQGDEFRFKALARQVPVADKTGKAGYSFDIV